MAKASRMAGYDAMELYIHDPGEKDVLQLKDAAAENGLQYCGICTGLTNS